MIFVIYSNINYQLLWTLFVCTLSIFDVFCIKLLYVMHYCLFDLFLCLGFGSDKHTLFGGLLVCNVYLFGGFLICFVFHMLYFFLIIASLSLSLHPPSLSLSRNRRFTSVLVVVCR
ncbi:hypothetical protein Hanom_Chr07g00669791 [Helianthus anomalus]